MKLKVALLIILFLYTGCSFDSSKFVPSFLQTSAGLSTKNYTTVHKKRAVNVIRAGVTFSDGSYITPKGEGDVILPRGYYYISSDSGRILAANKYGDMLVLKLNGDTLSQTKLESSLVSGLAYYAGVAYLLQGNRFGIYDPFNKRIKYQKQFPGGSVVDTRIANPVIYAQYIAIPTLDGKLVFINLKTPQVPAVVAIGAEKAYGNIIYLKTIGNYLVAATPHKVYVLDGRGKKEYPTKVADLTIKNNIIYLLTRDGKVQKLNLNLEPIQTKEFAYADFATIAARNNKIYAFAKSGSLVVMDDNMQKHNVYSVGAAKQYSYVSGDYLYIDNRKINLSALNYE